jgi:hypothetical protein
MKLKRKKKGPGLNLCQLKTAHETAQSVSASSNCYVHTVHDHIRIEYSAKYGQHMQMKQHKAVFVTFSARRDNRSRWNYFVRRFMKLAAIARVDIDAWLSRPARENKMFVLSFEW